VVDRKHMEDAAAACMRVLRRLPPTQVEKGLAGLGRLVEDQQLLDQCHQKADKPLTLAQCQETNSPFLQCEFNREGDSFRSPWSNRYQPPLEEATRLPDHLRQLEMQANERFEEYRRLYFEGGVGSVYLWPTTGSDFAGCFLIKRGTKVLRPVQRRRYEDRHLGKFPPNRSFLRLSQQADKLQADLYLVFDVRTRE